MIFILPVAFVAPSLQAERETESEVIPAERVVLNCPKLVSTRPFDFAMFWRQKMDHNRPGYSIAEAYQTRGITPSHLTSSLPKWNTPHDDVAASLQRGIRGEE